jgi:hypothetical protein
MIAKDHLTEEGFLRVISLKTALNRGISKKLKEEFPNVTILSSRRAYQIKLFLGFAR